MSSAQTTTQQELVDLLCTLVDVPSVSRNEDQLTELLRGLIPPSLKIVYDDDSVVVAMPANRNRNRPLVVLTGHTDTVPIAGNLPSRIEAGVIHGCGTGDMKAGIAVMVKIAEWWHANSDDTQFDLGLCLFGREELGEADNPLPAMFDNCPEIHTTDLALIMEPTSNAVEVGCQGAIDLVLTFRGEAAHSARPWMGENAAHKAIQALQELCLQQSNDVDIDGMIFREVANVTGFESGVAHNVIPPVARVDVNIRFAPNRLKEDVEAAWIARYEGVAEVSVLSSSSGGSVAATHPLVLRLVESGAAGLMPKQAWTNVADFTARGISAVNFGAGDPLYAHRADERLEIDALFENYRVLHNFFQKD